MKKQVMKSMLTLTMTVVFAVPMAAQTDLQSQTASIPFDFEAGGRACAKGDYTVTRTTQQVVKLTNHTTQQSTLVTLPVKSEPVQPTSPHLTFTQSRDGFRLAEVWMTGTPGMVSMSARRNFEASVTVPVK